MYTNVRFIGWRFRDEQEFDHNLKYSTVVQVSFPLLPYDIALHQKKRGNVVVVVVVFT